MSKNFSNQMKWIQAPQNLKLESPYLKGIPLRPIGDNKIQYEVNTQKGSMKMQIINQKTHLMSNGKIYDDMCNMDILNEPEVLNNLVQRYKSDKIFTFIGPTLVVVNPYRILPEYFSNQIMLKIRNKVLQGKYENQNPHIYLIAGNAFNSMIDQQKKQAIVISGESGAGKTQSTKYCMQLLTSLSHRQTHPIEVKILSCNPILQAFGNSKTLRNDNSSRFGKYVQIYFGKDHKILGASINSYLLEKSRVVAPAEGQRNYHIFYCLIASGIMSLKSAKEYKYLQKSKCYQVPSINDKEYFKEIKKSMENIGFSQKQQKKIWELLCCVLQLGNIQYEDKNHKENQSKPCELKDNSRKSLQKLSILLEIKEADLEKILLFQKKLIIKQVLFSAYNKQKCLANTNTLSKAIYNAIFEFILFKIQHSLKPEGNMKSNKLSINILDIFGFQNFLCNSFEQFCINFTNEKLLKLYNQYVFQRQMKILKEDGLDSHITQIKAPTNDQLIDLISGKMSLFSIINDYTLPQQYKDSDIISAFQNKFPKTGYLQFEKLNKSKFIISHSQCSVKYQIQTFKQKNQDKVIPQIANIVNNLFQHQSKEQAGKTLLTKFCKQIDELMQQLTSSSVHFIRCIKPNQKKIPKFVQQKYMLTQVRYLGVFQTIQIRKKTFPSRWVYQQFIQRFQSLFPRSKGSMKEKTEKILSQLTKDPKDYLLGNQRVYMNSQLQHKLLKKLHQMMKRKIQSGKAIWKAYKRYKFRIQIKQNLKKLSKRIKIWRKIGAKYQLQSLRKKFGLIKEYAKQKIQKQKIAQQKKLLQQKKARQKQQEKEKKQKIQKRKLKIPLLVKFIEDKIQKNIKQSFQKIRKVPPRQVTHKKVLKKNNQTTKTTVNQKETPKNTKNPPILQKSFNEMDQTIIIQSSANQKNYERKVKLHQPTKDFDIHQSFLNQKSILLQDQSDTAFPGTLSVGFFKPQQALGLKKLKLILCDQYKPQLNDKQEDFLSPPSEDGLFQIEDTPSDLLNRIIQFDSKNFFKKVLRKRTNFFGISKDQDDILVVKNRPLSKSLTQIQEQYQIQAIKIFKQILKIAEQSKLQLVFKQVERLIFLCKSACPEIINEVLLQLVKQSNTPNQLNSIRVVQALAVFLHIYDPDEDFIMGVLNFLFKKLTQSSFTQRQTQYFRYIFKKLIRKLNQGKQINYMPIKYQIMALMCKRMISIPIYLPVGSSSHVKVQSYESLSDIKIRVMNQLGLDYKRLMPELFSFFQLTNYEGSSQERLLSQTISVWDLISYWQRSSERYIQQNQKPPSFYLILKLRFVYQCHYTDQQSIQIMFSQCFYDLFMGRIRMGLKQMGGLAACVKKLKYPQTKDNDYSNCYPAWALQKWNEQQLIKQMKEGVQYLNDPLTLKGITDSDDPEIAMKFKFLQIVQLAPLSLALTISTQNQFKLHFRHKMLYISENNEIQEQIPIKSITRYAEQDNKFVFQVRNSTKIRIIQTQLASICCRHLSLFQDLVTKKITSQSNHQSNHPSVHQNNKKNTNMILSGLQQ